MSVREIVTIGDPVLPERAREVTAEELATPAAQQLIDELIETRRAANDAGLAANQIGEALRIAAVEDDGDNPRYPDKPPIALRAVVNPTLEPVGDETVIINEVDHLDGVLFVDRADPRSLATWEQFDRQGREEFVARAAGLVRWVGS